MTIADLLGRIGLAFERTFYLVIGGEFGDLVLSDIGIIALIVVVSFPIVLIFLFIVLFVFMAIWETMFGDEEADLPPAEVESEMSVYLANRRAEESQRPWSYECNQCGCLFDRDPDGDDECPDCGSDNLSRNVF